MKLEFDLIGIEKLDAKIRRDVEISKDNSRSASSLDKSRPKKIYVDNQRRDLKFSMGDIVSLKLTPDRRKPRYSRGEKLSLRCIGFFEILDKIGKVAYRLTLPRKLVDIHDVFHVPQLKNYHPTHDHILNGNMLELRANLIYEEKPTEIVEESIKALHNKRIPIYKLYGDIMELKRELGRLRNT